MAKRRLVRFQQWVQAERETDLCVLVALFEGCHQFSERHLLDADEAASAGLGASSLWGHDLRPVVGALGCYRVGTVPQTIKRLLR